MKFFNFSLFFFFFSMNIFSQQKETMSLFFENKKQSEKIQHREMTFSILHMNLNVKPVFHQQILYGQAQLTISPYWYHAINNIQLDAKYMDIYSVKLKHKDSATATPLRYTYDSLMLSIVLNKTYTNKDTFDILISYLSDPKRIRSVESKAITDSKGLYFINPNKTEANLPQQIWTQGEPENNSVWFPTAEMQQQKFTQEISITVPIAYKTLSNGLLTKSIIVDTGLRTDKWTMNLPLSPYLVFFGVGEWTSFADSVHGIPLQYHVPFEFANSGKRIFEKTPKMISTFEQLFQVPFVWPKYDQVVIHNFVSGAMENATIVTHDAQALQDNQDLEDENIWENVIAHEIAHHWFGDLVTCKNWSNLTLNESFAHYSEYLWFEKEYGKDYADYYRHKETQAYFNASAMEKTLVRLNYDKPEDIFDEVSYNKGGAILHMLRKYLGDSVFFKSLQTYLLQYQFQTAEVANLRIAFEKISGQNLDWFFNQWYFSPGNPFVSVQRFRDMPNKKIQLIVKQNIQVGEMIYKMPLVVKTYERDTTHLYHFMLGAHHSNTDTLNIPYSFYPNLVSIDPDGDLLMIKDEVQTPAEYVYQLKKGTSYAEKQNALRHLANFQTTHPEALQALLEATYDSSYVIRLHALASIQFDIDSIKIKARPYLIQNYKTEKNNLVIAKLIVLLSKYKLPDFYKNNKNLIYSPSAKIAVAALQLIFDYDSIKNYNTIVQVLQQATNPKIRKQAFSLFLKYKKQHAKIDVNDYYKKISLNARFDILTDYLECIFATNNVETMNDAIALIKTMKQQLPTNYTSLISYIDTQLDNSLSALKIKNPSLYNNLHL